MEFNYSLPVVSVGPIFFPGWTPNTPPFSPSQIKESIIICGTNRNTTIGLQGNVDDDENSCCG